MPTITARSYKPKLPVPGATLILCATILAVCLFPHPAFSESSRQSSREGVNVCGTSPKRDRDAYARGLYQRALLGGSRSHPRDYGPLQNTASLAAVDFGDVAVLEDDDTFITRQNPFNLAGRSFRFESVSASAYRVVSTNTAYSPSAGTALRLGDDDSYGQALGFSFDFFGKAYSSVQINSDGNLTFVQGDIDSSDRDLGRFASGPPRIGPLFTDLDPSARGTVSVRSDPDRLTVTWDGVPDYEQSSSNARINSFSVKLFANGNIEFVYGTQVGTDSAVVGISPGGFNGGISPITYASGLPSPDLSGTIAEVFTLTSQIMESAIARRFLSNHPDHFDHITAFLAFDFSLGSGTFAYELGVKNEIQGIGLDRFDYSSAFGSNGRLRSFLNMGTLTGIGRYPEDPNQLFLGTNSTMGIMGQESGHRWLAFTPYWDGTTKSSNILGRDLAHWSFFYNSKASVMEGNLIEDRGAERASARFATVSATNTYSDLDQYIMGLRGKDEVSPSFLVLNPTGTVKSPASNPAIGVVFGGTRHDITVDSIIAANGTRIPGVLQAPKVFRQAFILVTLKGQTATAEQIKKVQNIRDAWVDFFNRQTGGRGWIVTNLQDNAGTIPTDIDFPSFQGNSNRFTGIALANWGSTPADVLFTAFDNSGSATANPQKIINPRMITLPPGAQTAMLAEQIHGLDLSDQRNGWIQAHSTSSQVSGFFLDGDPDQTFLTGAVAGNQSSKTLYFSRTQAGPGITANKNYRDRLSVVNPNSETARVLLQLFDEFGNSQGIVGRDINPLGRLSEDLTSLFPAIGSSSDQGYLQVTSNVGVLGYQTFDNDSTAFSLPAQAVTTATKIYSAQFASGGIDGHQYFSELNLVNSSPQDRSIQIQLIGNDGIRISGITNPVQFHMAPGSQLSSRGEFLFGLPDPSYATKLVEGSLAITADSPGILGDLTFGDPVSGRFIASLPLETNTASNLVLSQVAQGSAGAGKPYFTGIAAYNPNSNPVSLSIGVYSENGVNTGTATLTLPAGGRISKTLPQLISSITEQLRGYIRIASTGGPIVCFELFGDQSLSFLTAVPPIPLSQ